MTGPAPARKTEAVGDDDLRELERAARDGGPAARLRFARVLERVGRRDDALVALLPARGDAEVRREIARFPAWTHEDATAGRTRAIDVAPIRREPLVRFAVTPRAGRPARALLASPLGIVWVDREGTIAIDDDGAARWSCPEEAAAIVGDVVLLMEGRQALVGRDIWTGERLHDTVVDGFFSRRGLAGSLFIGVRTRDAEVFRLDDPRAAPRSRELLEIPGGFMDFAEADVVLAPDIALIGKSAEVLALDVQSGEVRYRMRGQLPRADAEGTVLSVGRRGGLAVHDRAGASLFSTDEPFVPLALASSFIVAGRTRGERDVVALERATGRVLATLIQLEDEEDLVSTAIAREMTYLVTTRSIVAVTIDGRVVWRIDGWSRDGEVMEEVAPRARSLVTTTATGRLYFWEEP